MNKVMKKWMMVLVVIFLITTNTVAESEIQSVSTDEIILSAHHLMTEVYGYDVSIVDAFRYVVEEKNTGFEIRVYPFSETDDCFIIMYDEDGMLQSSKMPEILDLSAYDKMVYDEHRTFQMFTLEEKAAYSEEYIPKVEAVMRLNPDYDGLHYDYTRSRYGLPQDGDLDQEIALEIAKQAAMEWLNLEDDWFDGHFWYQTYFDVTDPEQTLWKFYFGSTRPGRGKYVIRLNSKTGKVVKAFKYTGNMPLWEAL